MNGERRPTRESFETTEDFYRALLRWERARAERAEAELARLLQERDELSGKVGDAAVALANERVWRERAEAENARLREGLCDALDGDLDRARAVLCGVSGEDGGKTT